MPGKNEIRERGSSKDIQTLIITNHTANESLGSQYLWLSLIEDLNILPHAAVAPPPRLVQVLQR
jgi:hypothetical protein